MTTGHTIIEWPLAKPETTILFASWIFRVPCTSDEGFLGVLRLPRNDKGVCAKRDGAEWPGLPLLGKVASFPFPLSVAALSERRIIRATVGDPRCKPCAIVP
jgi:hypothetical protein